MARQSGDTVQGDTAHEGGVLDGKLAVITGGASGIGRACANRFAAAGAKSTALFLSSDQSSYMTVQTLFPAGGMFTG